MNLDQIFKTNYFKWSLLILVSLIVLLGVFRLGVLIGFRKANISYRWEENYPRNFGGPSDRAPLGMPRGNFPSEGFINPHGTAGQVLKIDGDTLVIKGDDNIEKTVVATSTTIIQKFRDQIKISDIKPDDHVIVIGNPGSNGQIEAKFIRVF